MLLVVGVLAALWEASGPGTGQVVDAAMVDGAALLVHMIWRHARRGRLERRARGRTCSTAARPSTTPTTCADGGYIAVGALEPQFYAALLDGLGLDRRTCPAQHDQAGWPELRARFAEVFATRTRDEWASVFDGTDACVTPVLTFAEAAEHPHLAARGDVRRAGRGRQAAPAPASPGPHRGCGRCPGPRRTSTPSWPIGADPARRWGSRTVRRTAGRRVLLEGIEALDPAARHSSGSRDRQRGSARGRPCRSGTP